MKWKQRTSNGNTLTKSKTKQKDLPNKQNTKQNTTVQNIITYQNIMSSFVSFVLGLASGMYIATNYDLRKLQTALTKKWGHVWEEAAEIEKEARKKKE